MRCLRCSRETHAAVGGLRNGAWSFENFCPFCRDASLCSCGLSYPDFQQNRLLGCENCYSAFQPELYLLLRRFRRGHKIAISHQNHSGLAQARYQELQAAAAIAPGTGSATELFGSEIIQNPENRPGMRDQQVLRLRLARNLPGLCYSGRGARQAGALLKLLFVDKGPLRSLAAAPFCYSRMYTGDEDHLRMEWIFFMKDLAGLLPPIKQQLMAFHNLLPWQFHSEFGYLAACPTNSGGGVRLSLRPGPDAHASYGERLELARQGLEIRTDASGMIEISNRYAYWPFALEQKAKELASIAHALRG